MSPAPGTPPPPPPPRRPDPVAAAIGGDQDMHRRVSAYPGTLTFHDLIRRNKRSSAFLMVVMVLLAAVVCAIIAGALVVYGGGDVESLVPSAAVGLVAGLIFACLASLWSWFGGAGAILAMSGAKPIEKPADPELYNVVDELRIAAGLPMPRIYLINDTAMNAFATGRDPAHGVVAITLGLRQKLSRDELQAVMAHEMAHVRHLDIRFAMLMATMVGLIAFLCDAFVRIAFRSVHFSGRRSRGKGGGAAVIVVLILAALLAILAPLAATIIQMSYSRRREYLADAGAVELTRNPLALASALQKLADDPEPLVDSANRGTAHMFIVNPLRKMRQAHQSMNSVFLSHPPIKERIARLLALAR